MARYQTHACRNCGAPLGIPDDHDRYFQCAHCGSVLEAVTPPDGRPGRQIQITIAQHATVDTSSLQSYANGRRRAGGIIVTLSVLFAVGVAAVTGFIVATDGEDRLGIADALTGSGGGRIHNYAAAADLPSDDGTADDVVAVARTSDELEIVYLDFDATPQLRWSVPRALESETFTQFVATDELVIVSADRELVALDRSTGAEAWSTTLTDAVQPNLCADCFRRYADAVVTLTVDGVLASTSVTSGEQQWSVTLVETPRQVVNLGGNPAVLDTVDGTTVLQVFSAVNGTTLESLPLSCPDRTFGGRNTVGIYDTLFPVLDGSVVYVADPSFGGCAQRWAAASGGEPLWELTYEYPNPSGATSDHVLVSAAGILIADRNVVDVIDLATGAPRRVIDLPDTDLLPIGEADGVLALAAKSTRGTASWSIRAVDLTAGTERWTFDLEAADSLVESRSFAIGDAWTASVTSAGLTVAQYRADRVELVVQNVDFATGTPSPPENIDLSGRGITDSLTIHGWSGDDLLAAMVGSFIVIDGPSGRIAAEAP